MSILSYYLSMKNNFLSSFSNFEEREIVSEVLQTKLIILFLKWIKRRFLLITLPILKHIVENLKKIFHFAKVAKVCNSYFFCIALQCCKNRLCCEIHNMLFSPHGNFITSLLSKTFNLFMSEKWIKIIMVFFGFIIKFCVF